MNDQIVGRQPEATGSRPGCPPLIVDGLAVAYPGTGPALTDASLVVAPGQVVGVVGHSASGKSTLLSAIVGVLADEAAVLAGRIILHGEDLAEMAPNDRRRLRGRSIGLVPQNALYAWNPVRTIGDHIDETLAEHRRPWSRTQRGETVASWCDRLAIPAATLQRHAAQLSGGMRQRAALLLALCGQPSILLADEPTSALDTVTQAEVLALLRAVTDDEGLATVIVTHDLAAAATVADDLVVIDQGRIVEHGPTAQLLTAAQHDHTRALIAATMSGVSGVADARGERASDGR